MRYDVTVLGAGIFGLATAWACAARGAKVQVIDPNGIGAGSSGGVVGALAPHVPEQWNAKKQFQFEALDGAAVFWAGVADAANLPSGYARVGRVQPIMDQAGLDLARARQSGAKTHWQGRYIWDIRPAADYAPWITSPTAQVIFDSLSARLAPRQGLVALAAALRAKGGQIVSDAPLMGAVVEATGAAGLAELSDAFGAVVGAGQKGQAAILDADMGSLPQLFIDGVHFVPHEGPQGRGQVAIGSTSERDFNDPSTTDANLDLLIEKARSLCPALAKAQVVTRWAGLRPRAKSRAPMLGRHPLRTDHFIANGGFKIGFGIAPRVADVMADLVLEGRDTIPSDFAPVVSLPAQA